MDEPRDKNGLTEEEFLAAYDASRYPRPSVTVDIAVFVVGSGVGEAGTTAGEASGVDAAAEAGGTSGPIQARLLLIKRGGHPFIGRWALPGGFVGNEETLEQAAQRELAEETGISAGLDVLRQLHTFSDPQRDPRTRIITCLYMLVLDSHALTSPIVKAGDDAAELRVFALDEVWALDLAGDHAKLISHALQSLVGDLGL
jgi:ADP-ribose pyrophosphatase YjhB (NUDIX family)